MLDCREVVAKLGRFLDGELAPHEARPVETHVQACPGCQRELRALQSLSASLEEFSAPPCPGRHGGRVMLLVTRARPVGRPVDRGSLSFGNRGRSPCAGRRGRGRSRMRDRPPAEFRRSTGRQSESGRNGLGGAVGRIRGSHRPIWTSAMKHYARTLGVIFSVTLNLAFLGSYVDLGRCRGRAGYVFEEVQLTPEQRSRMFVGGTVHRDINTIGNEHPGPPGPD